MPRITTLRALRFTGAAGDTADLLAPPYDVIDDAERARLAARSPHNLVHLTLPEPSDPSKPDSRYDVARRTLEGWRADGTLALEPRPALFALAQRFTLPGGEEVVRTGVVCRMRLYDFDEGVVLPHERILSAPLEDRLKLTRATRTELEPIFLVFSDGTGAVREALADARSRPALASARTGDGVVQSLHRIDDDEVIARVVAAAEAERAVIADGHHRYQTALAYRDEVGASDEGPHRFVLAFLCPLEDPGLTILPTHRLLHSVAGLDAASLLERAREVFEVRGLDADPRTAPGRAAILESLAEAGQSHHALALVTPDGAVNLLTLAHGATLPGPAAELPEAMRVLDVTVLHSVLLGHLLGLSAESQARKENLDYPKSSDEALDRILAAKRPEDGQALFVMNATPMEQVRAAAIAGVRMPQKSTFFFPKLPSGLFFYSLDPGDA